MMKSLQSNENIKIENLRYFMLIFIFAALICSAFSACSGGDTYTVSFRTNGGAEVSDITTDKSGIELPGTTRLCYTFDGWFDNEALSGDALPSPFAPLADVTLYAKWTENHDYASTVIPPTCTVKGVEIFTCTVCTHIKLDYIAAGHDDDSSICTKCGELQFTPGLEFVLNSDGESYFVTRGSATDSEVLISARYKGKSVTAIGEYAFNNCKSLTSVTLPDSLTAIGTKAFAYCESLTNVILPDGLTAIGEQAFWYCESLTSVTLPDGLTVIGEYAFAYCKSLPDITLPDTLRHIGDYAFYRCESLTRIELPYGLERIGNYAFSFGEALTSVTLPSSLKDIGNYAFGFCQNLTSITLPKRLERIGNYAFSRCARLITITIPLSVTFMGFDAFNGCGELTTINCESVSQPTVGTKRG